MIWLRFFLPTVACLFSAISLLAQTHEHTGWLFFTHTQKLSDKINLLADVQFRSADDYKYLGSLLLRGAVRYGVSKDGEVGAGYAYLGQWEEEDGDKIYSREHRSFEQYQHKVTMSRKTLNLRARLEQRFVKEEEIKFSQRLRAYASLQIPLIANIDFTKGTYLKIQDEIFFNVQNKENVNGSVFDQHRPYIAAGYRVTKQLDLELGYLHLRQREADAIFLRHTLQLMITTSF